MLSRITRLHARPELQASREEIVPIRIIHKKCQTTQLVWSLKYDDSAYQCWDQSGTLDVYIGLRNFILTVCTIMKNPLPLETTYGFG